MSDMLYIRDSIEINQALASRVTSRSVGPGDTLRLVARSVRHDAGYTLQLPGSHVIVVAQDYDGNGGGIAVDGTVGSAGTAGHAGMTGRMGENGGPGGDGSAGGAGTPGGSVRVLCEHFEAGTFSADGGPGGSGGAGGSGGNGGIGRPPIPRKTEGTPPGAGGPGGDGGDGGDGAAGGSVTVQYVLADAAPVSRAAGGSGGAGGAAGPGGHAGIGPWIERLVTGTTALERHPVAAATAVPAIGLRPVGKPTVPSVPVGVPRLPAGGHGPGPITLPPGHPGGNGTSTGGTGTPTGGNGTSTGSTGTPTGSTGTPTIPTLPRPQGASGTAGAAGTTGAAGSVSTRQLTVDDYWTAVAQVLGSDTDAWADMRLKSGEFFYRRANVPSDGPQTNLSTASQEFDRVLRLRPSDADASRLSEQISLNQNVLGLPNDMDVTPNFPQYIDAYTAWGPLVFGVFNQGVEALLTATDMQTVTQQLAMHVADIKAAITDAAADHTTAVAGQNSAQQAVTFATQKVDTLTTQIQAAKTAMENQSISFGDIIKTVADVAGAVIAVIGAIPTAGASLVALVPACISLAKTVFDDGPALIGQLFGDGSVPDDVKKAYAAAGKDVQALDKAGKAIINLVDVIDKLDQAKTEANAKYTELVKQGVEAAHALMLAQLGKTQADLQVAGAQVKIDQAQQLEQTCLSLMDAEKADFTTILSAGQVLIAAAGLQRDRLLRYAFYAQRAVEIYTEQDESESVRMDSGTVDPDVLADYAEQFLPLSGMTSAYTASWSLFLTPTTLEDAYLAYFDGQSSQLDLGWYRITVTDPDEIARFVQTRSLDFDVEVGDLPAGHVGTKIQSPAVAFVGATSPSGATSCEVWHGPRYEQLRSDGSIDVQLLRPHTDTVSCPLSRLADAGVRPVLGDSLEEPILCPFWGRGVGGQWNVRIPDEQIDKYGTDISKLTEIDIWIAYTFASQAA